MSDYQDIEETLEALRDAIMAGTVDAAAEIVTALLLQYMAVLGRESETFTELFPALEALRADIMAQRWPEAQEIVVELLSVHED